MYIYPVLFSSPSSFVFYTNSRNTVQASSWQVPASELTEYSTPSASTSSSFCCFCSFDSPPMNQTVGKHYSSPLAALFLIPAYSNSNSTVIIILKVTFRPSAIQREGSAQRALDALFKLVLSTFSVGHIFIRFGQFSFLSQYQCITEAVILIQTWFVQLQLDKLHKFRTPNFFSDLIKMN